MTEGIEKQEHWGYGMRIFHQKIGENELISLVPSFSSVLSMAADF
jgi:hypothetical protein